MKFKLSALAMAAVSTTTFAQSNLTISGAIDLAMRHVDDGVTTQNQLVREGSGSSKLVFSGSEDLGGGLKAGFFLDSAVRADNGTASSSTFWERRSTVSLVGPMGEIRLGRDVSVAHTTPGDFDALNGKGVGNLNNLATPFNFSNATTFVRVNNAVSYFTPVVLGGLTAQLQLAPGEGAAGNKYVGGGVGYNKGPIESRFTYGQTNVSTVAVINPVTGASTVQNLPSQGKFKYIALGGSYDFGVARVLGSMTEWVSAPSLGGLKRKQLNYNIGATVPVGQGSVNFAYTRANRLGLGSDEQDASQFALQYQYNLSKRTALYATAARLTQDALAAADTSATGSRYNMDGTPVIGRKATGLDLGIRHKF